MTDPDQTAARLLELAEGGRPRPAIELGLGLLADGMAPADVIVGVLAPTQRQVGVLWEQNRWSVADEHAATAVVDGVLGALALEVPVHDRPHGHVLAACAEGEHHTMPARMGVELLRADGWEVTFLGGSLPADDLQRFAAEHEPDVVVVSCTVPLALPGARRCFAAIDALGLPALGAGAAFGTDASRALRLGARGWLGQGMQLATVLRGLERESLAQPVPGEALALELGHEDLRGLCLSTMTDRVPAMATYSPAQQNSTRNDIGYILEFLRIAVDLDEDQIFHAFVGWLAGVLTSRGVPPFVLAGSLQIIGEVLDGEGMAQAARLCGSAVERREPAA